MSQYLNTSRVFLVNKPAGVSSFRALNAVKRCAGTRKVGHGGTLDPFATGLLIAFAGKMTKAASLVAESDKEYFAVFRFGEETDTLDTEGVVVEYATVPDFAAIKRGIPQCIGHIHQAPPRFSAIKINGQRAYSAARKGEVLDMPLRQVRIDLLDVLDWSPPLLSVRICCSKGTYIRSIARDLGLAANSRAHCVKLQRSSIGPFSLDQAKEPESLTADCGLSPTSFAHLLDIPVIPAASAITAALRTGVPIERMHENLNLSSELLALITDERGSEVALLQKKGVAWSYRIVFD